MSKVDWTKAPEDAEVWIEDLHPENGDYESGFCYSEGDTWADCNSPECWSKKAEAEGKIKVHYRPKTPSWNGEGFPPAGIECEYFRADFNKWVGCTTIGMFRGEMVCAPDGGGFMLGKVENFRPIKTGREKWIEEVYNALVGRSFLASKETVGAIYDAGLAKLP